ncbi:hypothetical protein PG994_009204 [Apiospora phragmitis]|uniref:Uncharacterized protein n=1 Tax=Apiospora phragmitis TaxID=2905665 RepID=A0ABR1UIK3_9PEZI
MGGGSTRVTNDGSGTQAVAVDHQHYYRRHHAIAGASQPQVQTAVLGNSSLADLRSHKAPQIYKHKTPYSFTQVQPPTKVTGIRHAGPRHPVMTPLVADHHLERTERSPRSTRRRSPDRTGHRERQTECSSPGGTRRSPREASAPNFSRKTTPSPQKGRSRSNSKTSDMPAKVREAEEPVSSQDGGFILQAKTYQPLGHNTTVISRIQPQTSHFSPSTESESSGILSTPSNRTMRTFSSLNTTPSQTPVEAEFRSPVSKHGSSSSSHDPRERSLNPSHALSLNKALPLLPATIHQPIAPEEAETTGQKKPLAGHCEPVPKQQGSSRRAIGSPFPPKQPLSSALNAAPPVPAISNNSKQEAKAHPATVAACDVSILGLNQ